MRPSSPVSSRTYIYVFLLTAGIFALAFFVSSYLGEKKTEVLRTSSERIATDILSLETQFELLQESTCSSIQNTTLSDEINALGERLALAESQQGTNADVLSLKKYYSVLQIKDFLLMNKVSARCHAPVYSVLYFYGNTTCERCADQGYILTYFRKDHPNIRVYSFDANIDVSAVKTLVAIHNIHTLPALVIGTTTYTGFQDVEKLTTLFPPQALATSTVIQK
jgi:hypothetical protein